ncbi:uncharacterized protein LOC128555021 [Mercenaria mercenaria]|uniref:uncharacterized protein LOC128555021 n=1 Tax=Mercenaria mercenaria TaxID=6596 RepID=UPI00234EC2EE|nr:uncharacterized protein LOC128555021 [Mercenaria mercenaria]
MAEAKVPKEVSFDPYKLLLYHKAIRTGKERENILRINIVGNYAQGKTSLARRLFGQTCEGVTTTNGIEINRRTCRLADSGIPTFTSAEYESHEHRLAKVASSIDKSKLSERYKTEVFSLPDIKTEEIEQPTGLSAEEYAAFSRNVEKHNDTSPKYFDIWDFGGQYIFYATHTLFHSSRALYLLVFDLTKPLDTVVRDEEYPGETGDRNMEYFARFWMESIHAYVGPEAQVILVGTHKDKLERNELLWGKYFEEVRCLFDDTDLIHHIQKEDFAVDNHDMSDLAIADLFSLILKKHQELTQFVEIPARWIQLEKALRKQNFSPIISFQNVIEIDKESEYPLRDEEQLKLFLHYHHEKGSLFFFDEDPLSDCICLEPRYLIDAFKCIITSERFCRNDPGIRSHWKALTKEGRLSNNLIDNVWSDKAQNFMKHKVALLGFLKKHNIIAEVTEYNVDTEERKQMDWYIVPSLLQDHSVKKEMTSFLTGKHQSNVRYSLQFESSAMVHMTYYRIVCTALGQWDVVNYGKTDLLFENLCVFRMDDHAGLIEQRKCSGTIELRLIHLKRRPVESRLADKLRRFVESVIINVFRRLKYQKGDGVQQFTRAYRCNHAEHGPGGSSKLTLLKEDEDVICPDNFSHDNFDNRTAKEEWFPKEDIYPNVQLTEKILGQIAQGVIGENWQLLGNQLGIDRAEIYRINEKHLEIEMRIFLMLCKWKERSADTATLKMLVEEIDKCPRVRICWDKLRNIKDKYLREQEKGQIQPLVDKSVEIDNTLTLECKISKPNVQVTWLKDSTPLNPDGRITISSEGCHHQLVLEHTTMEDAAKYTCVFGDSKTEWLVQVENHHSPFKFVKELKDIKIEVAPNTATFICEVNTSESLVEWYFHNQHIEKSNKYEMIDDGPVHKLIIRDVSEEDEGKYSIIANGLRSDATLKIEVTVKEIYLYQQGRRLEETVKERFLYQQGRRLEEINVMDREKIYCVLCRMKTNTNNIVVSNQHGRGRQEGICSVCHKKKSMLV